jgi:DNA-binding MarR family transcriptional regulator
MATKSNPKPTKPETILKLISRSMGANIGALEKATGWKPHSVRAALTGLRKKGHLIERRKDTKRGSVYHLDQGAAS